MIIKTKSEIQFSIIGAEINLENGTIAIIVNAKNPYIYPCSLKDLKYKIGVDGEWLPALLYTEQEINLNDISLSGRTKRFKIIWDAATDLNVTQIWNNVILSLILNDRANLSGADSEAQEYIISLIDFTIKDIKNIVLPYSNDPYFNVMFINKKTCRHSLAHFKIDIASDKYFTEILKTFNSQLNQNGWQVEIDGNLEDFPEIGIAGEFEYKIYFNSEELSELTEDRYYIRVIPIYN